MSQEKWFFFIILLFIVPTSLSYSFAFVPVEIQPVAVKSTGVVNHIEGNNNDVIIL